MNRRIWVIAAPAAVLTITFLLFAWMSHGAEAQAAKTPRPAIGHTTP